MSSALASSPSSAPTAVVEVSVATSVFSTGAPTKKCYYCGRPGKNIKTFSN